MERRNIFIGENPVRVNEAGVEGAFVQLDGERYYKISSVDRMPDFFISLVSASDQWMFISSNGSLTAGRKNPEGALFPYYSEDKIHDFHGKTGSCTLILVKEGERKKLWEPFAGNTGIYAVKRNLYKNLSSNKLVFEEINEDLGMTFRYGWYSSERYGFVRRSTLLNQGAGTREVELLDGLQNILPSHVNPGLQLSSSNLLDAYKRQELVPGTSLALYRLSSVPSDTAEPSESLRVNTVWSEGLRNVSVLLSSRQVDAFRSGYVPEQEHDIKAARGAYFIHASLELPGGTRQTWNMVAEVNQDAAGLAALTNKLGQGEAAGAALREDIERSSTELLSLLASSDAMQSTADELSCSRHLSNVLFNVMRGGVFADNYLVQAGDFMEFISRANTALVPLARKLFEGDHEGITHRKVLERACAGNKTNLIRLSYEYLPLTFSRRHGDPSRPWNRFSIENRKVDGSRKLGYQGNWRDIFQNWEALSLSFPGYVESMISKFVNASTADGYNPYRITSDGIDWEVPDPSDPWSNIGYWGDHQVIYLLKFLEISVNHHPGRLQELLTSDFFSYANVPYQIKPYRELAENPQNTILFDHDLEKTIRKRIEAVGSDGCLVWDREEQVVLVNLAEKLLVVLLSKLSNFIPGAGIWMNTQRPEWNDANNALVGFGVSMVTTCYLRAYAAYFRELLRSSTLETVRVSAEMADFFRRMKKELDLQMQEPEKMLTGQGKKRCMDAFGQAGSDYRQHFYREGFSGRKKELQVKELLDFFDRALQALDDTISSNRRPDQLFHAYNLIRVDGSRVILRRLYEMLEGQVAVLSSGFLKPVESLELLDALKSSKLFREDQYSYILYPDRALPSFLEINIIPATEIDRSELLKTLIRKSDQQIVVRDVNGATHFHADFRNAGFLEQALDRLPEEYSTLLDKERDLILDIYDKVFDHQSFTGRSGTFYGYEGLGSIYWHMVSKLLLAVCETYYRAAECGANAETLGRLAEHYYEIRAGIGLNKAPDIYGAFPTDPYSHTPGNRGAQQPGMTGQVKEDIVARWAELGVRVRNGCIRFQPVLLRRMEFFPGPGKFDFQDLRAQERSLLLEKDTLGFSYCQVPVLYHLAEVPKIELLFRDGTKQQIEGLTLHPELSAGIFDRSGELVQLDVWLTPGL
ncbi:MAG: hypothetical protein P1P86_07505 [Bacteroidales bacterium]|nr:hypothetical protein [Bacteroidales bacterium]